MKCMTTFCHRLRAVGQDLNGDGTLFITEAAEQGTLADKKKRTEKLWEEILID